MSKTLLAVVVGLMLSTGTAKCVDGLLVNLDGLYQVWFSPDYMTAHNLTYPNSTYQFVIKIDAVNKVNPNWVLVEYPQAANQSFNSSMAGKRWLNLNYIVELRPYTLPGQGQSNQSQSGQ